MHKIIIFLFCHLYREYQIIQFLHRIPITLCQIPWPPRSISHLTSTLSSLSMSYWLIYCYSVSIFLLKFIIWFCPVWNVIYIFTFLSRNILQFSSCILLPSRFLYFFNLFCTVSLQWHKWQIVIIIWNLHLQFWFSRVYVNLLCFFIAYCFVQYFLFWSRSWWFVCLSFKISFWLLMFYILLSWS